MISLRFPTMIDQHLSATELLMESQKLAGTFDLNQVLKQARHIYQQLVDLPEVNSIIFICNIFENFESYDGKQ